MSRRRLWADVAVMAMAREGRREPVRALPGIVGPGARRAHAKKKGASHCGPRPRANAATMSALTDDDELADLSLVGVVRVGFDREDIHAAGHVLPVAAHEVPLHGAVAGGSVEREL